VHPEKFLRIGPASLVVEFVDTAHVTVVCTVVIAAKMLLQTATADE